MNKLDFGNVFNDAFEIYKKSFAPMALAIAIVFAVFLVLYLAFFPLLFGLGFMEYFALAAEDPGYVAAISQSPRYLLVMALFGLLMSAVIAPLTAGLINMCRNVKHNIPISTGQLFHYYKSKYLGNLLVASLIISLVSSVFSVTFQSIGMPVLVYIPTLLITTFTIVMIPLIIYKENNATDAIKNSFNAVGTNFMVVLGLVIVGFVCACVGAIACGIGIIFTFPFYFAIQYSIFAHLLGDETYHEIDEIGKEGL